MPLERFESFEDAERALWLPSGHPKCIEKWAALLALTRRMHPDRQQPRGVQKYSSVLERSDSSGAESSRTRTPTSE